MAPLAVATHPRTPPMHPIARWDPKHPLKAQFWASLAVPSTLKLANSAARLGSRGGCSGRACVRWKSGTMSAAR